jgi:hypothetical protein
VDTLDRPDDLPQPWRFTSDMPLGCTQKREVNFKFKNLKICSITEQSYIKTSVDKILKLINKPFVGRTQVSITQTAKTIVSTQFLRNIRQ